MSLARFARGSAVLAIGAAIAVSGWQVYAQSAAQPTNDAPNPYQTIEGHFKLPDGRTWGSTSAVDISPDGQFIWVAERCGANSCLDRATGQMSKLPSILKFDQSGKLVASFGGGMLIFPHGIHIDRQGNVWVTDGQDNAPDAGAWCAAGGGRGGAGAGGGARSGADGAACRSHHRPSGLQVQPRGQAADDDREGRAAPRVRPTAAGSRTTSSRIKRARSSSRRVTAPIRTIGS